MSSGRSHGDGSVSLCRAANLKLGCCSQPARGAFPREQPRYLRPWALTVGKPKPAVWRLALKWFGTKKGNTVLWTWEECVCCFSSKANACDCPIANEARGHWFTVCSVGLGLAVSLRQMLPRQQARLVPCYNLNQAKLCSDTDYNFPQQAYVMD